MFMVWWGAGSRTQTQNLPQVQIKWKTQPLLLQKLRPQRDPQHIGELEIIHPTPTTFPGDTEKLQSYH